MTVRDNSTVNIVVLIVVTSAYGAIDPSLYLVLRARLEKYGDDVYCAGGVL